MPEDRSYQISLSLGSNIHPETNLVSGIDQIKNHFKVLKVSSVWSTPPVGMDGSHFLNAAILIQTNSDPDNLKCDILRPIEVRLGRVRSADKFSPRTIDIDIQTVDQNIVDDDLWNQVHLAAPIAELLPEIKDNSNQKNLLQRSRDLRSESPIEIFKLNLTGN